MNKERSRLKKPEWLRAKLPSGPEYGKVRGLVDENLKLVEHNQNVRGPININLASDDIK